MFGTNFWVGVAVGVGATYAWHRFHGLPPKKP